MKFYIYLIFFCLSFSIGFAQEASEKNTLQENDFKVDEVFQRLEELYNLGDMQGLIELFENQCLVKNAKNKYKESSAFKRLRRRKKEDFYALVSEAYLTLNRPKDAEPYIEQLFGIRHYDEELNGFWPELQRIRKEDYDVLPNFMVGFHLGIKHDIVTPTKRYSIFTDTDLDNTNNYQKNYFGLKDYNVDGFSPGTSIGFKASYFFNKNIAVNLGFSSTTVRYGYHYAYAWANEYAFGSGLLQYNYEHVHKQNYFDLNLEVPFQIQFDRWAPFASLYFEAGRLSFAEKDIFVSEKPILIFEDGSVDNTIPAVNREVTKDLKNNLASYRGSIGGGLGVNYYFNKWLLQAKVNYAWGFTDMVLRDKRYNQEDVVYGYHDLLDDFRVNTLQFKLAAFMYLRYKAFKKHKKQLL